jgi:hypothetical protein
MAGTDDAASEAVLTPDDLVWSGNQQVSGLYALPTLLAGTPVAVLAGFDLATALLVVGQRPTPDHWDTWATSSSTLLLCGAAAFLATLVLSVRAQFVAIDPEQARTWFPEMVLGDGPLETIRKLVWQSQQRIKRLMLAAVWVWTGGLMLTAVGAALGVLSYKINFGHILAACVLGLGTSVVAVMFNWSTGRVPKELRSAKPPPHLTSRARELILGGRSAVVDPKAKGADSSAKNSVASSRTDLHVTFADGRTVIFKHVDGQSWTVDDPYVTAVESGGDASVNVKSVGTFVKFTSESEQ